jgi:branched-chain amino acid transport system permease protein
VFAVCVALWFRVSNILNLAVGDFAMIGALGVDNLVRVHHWPVAGGILATLAAAGAAAYLYDRVILRLAQDGKRRQEGIVITFFFTFALSFFLEGLAEILFGTNVYAAPTLWQGNSLSLGSLHFERAGLLVLGCAVVSGVLFTAFIRYTLAGKAVEACGENYIGARIVGVDTRQYRRSIFVVTAVLAAVFGILQSPLTGYSFNTGSAISLTGFIAAAYAGFQKPGRAVVAGVAIGVLESILGGYVSTQYNDTILYAILAGLVLLRPSAMGLDVAVGN